MMPGVSAHERRTREPVLESMSRAGSDCAKPGETRAGKGGRPSRSHLCKSRTRVGTKRRSVLLTPFG